MNEFDKLASRLLNETLGYDDPDDLDREGMEGWYAEMPDWEWAIEVLNGRENTENDTIEIPFNDNTYVLHLNKDGSAKGIEPGDDVGTKIFRAIQHKDTSIDPRHNERTSGSSSWA